MDPERERAMTSMLETAVQLYLGKVALQEKTHTDMFPKLCRVCNTHHALSSWIALPFKGTQKFSDGEVLELRDCPCGSTLAVVLIPSPEIE